jgi:hypothetical protein
MCGSRTDGFVESPISALRFIPLSLRRTGSTPHSTGFARLELGLFTKPSGVMTFFESIRTGCGGRYKEPRVWLKHIHFFIVYLKTFFKSTEFPLRMSS